MVTVIYDNTLIAQEDVNVLSEALQNIVAKAIDDDDVFVYVINPEMAYGADPVEIFVQVNTQKTTKPDEVLNDIAVGIQVWKTSTSYTQSLNLNVVPIDWYSKIKL